MMWNLVKCLHIFDCQRKKNPTELTIKLGLELATPGFAVMCAAQCSMDHGKSAQYTKTDVKLTCTTWGIASNSSMSLVYP